MKQNCIFTGNILNHVLFMKKEIQIIIFSVLFCGTLFPQYLPLVSKDQRGRIDAERSGTHDANRIRTVFYNYGMVGDYPPDPLNVDYSVFHSVEVPKGSGENYCDGTTPFVLARIKNRNGADNYIMETGYRERQGTSPVTNKTMRFEPRPGYFQADPAKNTGRSVAMSNDPRTWPDTWIDKMSDPDDPGWSGYWNGYFGKSAGADQESYVVFDDDYYDAWNYYPDVRDNTRRGLGLKIEQRGFQWANPQAGNVIFFHNDIANEGTTNYDDNIIFGLYMDSGVGGSGVGVDGIPESDDDNAYFDKSAGLNLVYTWDKYGHGVQGTTGYLGYAYMETPGNSSDGIDNDDDGITDEARDSGPGQKIVGQDAIRNYVVTHYNLQKFEAFYGPLEERPAFKAGVWFTGDEDMDWVAEYDDTGADGIFGTHDTGEGDEMPTAGEPNFDKTDKDESDQIGLTGFKMNRIKAGSGNPSTEVDNIVFYDDGKEWPHRLYDMFSTQTNAFDNPVAMNYNIAFLFASGPFRLTAGKTERFSLALAFGADLRELRTTVKVVQQIYKANYQFAVPPPMPTLSAFSGDGFVTLTWDDKAERAYDPITNNNDFEGYKIYRSTDPTFLDPQVITTATGTGPIGNGKPIAQFDLVNGIEGFSTTTVEGVSYYLGSDNGITHTFKDTTVTNGQLYYYAICAYDRGVDSIQIYPSENSITVSQTLRGGIILPKNVVQVTPNPMVDGYKSAEVNNITHTLGYGTGTVAIQIKSPAAIPDNHTMQIDFTNPNDSVRAEYYRFIDLTTHDTLFTYGQDFDGAGIGSAAGGMVPVISTLKTVQIDSLLTGFLKTSSTNAKFSTRYQQAYIPTLKRTGYPENINIVFSNTYQDTSVAAVGVPAKPAKFKVIAKTNTGDVKLKFRFRDYDNNGTINSLNDYIEILTAPVSDPNNYKATWRIDYDTSGQGSGFILKAPAEGDVFNLALKVPFSQGDVFTFKTVAQSVDNNKAKSDYNQKPYVVPNPYVGAASFEPQRYAVSGRGERKIEFRALPQKCTIRIFTVKGELVKTLEHDGNMNNGYISWDLRTKDNLEIAPGLYIYHVESPGIDSYIGKFAVIK